MVVKKRLPVGEHGAERYYPPNLHKKERLSGKKTLSVLFNKNLRFKAKSGSITITFIPNKEWKVAILIKKRVGSAVRRNFIKRKIRENPKNSDLNNLSNTLLSTLLQK